MAGVPEQAIALKLMALFYNIIREVIVLKKIVILLNQENTYNTHYEYVHINMMCICTLDKVDIDR